MVWKLAAGPEGRDPDGAERMQGQLETPQRDLQRQVEAQEETGSEGPGRTFLGGDARQGQAARKPVLSSAVRRQVMETLQERTRRCPRGHSL